MILMSAVPPVLAKLAGRWTLLPAMLVLCASQNLMANGRGVLVAVVTGHWLSLPAGIRILVDCADSGEVVQ